MEIVVYLPVDVVGFAVAFIAGLGVVWLARWVLSWVTG